jgi:Methane/Phenol/Alkene Hydroxylase
MSASTRASRRASAFQYIKPAKRRATQYEEITLHTQWDPKNFAAQGWFNYDASGRPIWNEDSTLLRATDWWAYRDPQAEWFKPFVKRQADTGRAIEQAINGARRAQLFANFDPQWTAFLEEHYCAYRYAEYGLFMALCHAQREAGSDVVAQPIVFQAVEKDRHAQDITLYGLELEKNIPGFSDSQCKQVWMTSPQWQPARLLMERLLAARDWGEIFIVINYLVDPLFSALFNRELVLRNASVHGDPVTSVIAEGAEVDREIRRHSSREFTRLLCEQLPENRDVINAWIVEWADTVRDACVGLEPLFATLPHAAVTFEQAYARVNRDFDEIKSELELILV